MTKENFFYFIFFTFVYFFLIFFENQYLLGRWESNTIFFILRPMYDPFFPVIQKAADTVGNFDIGYPLLGFSRVFSKFFYTNIFFIKSINIIYGILALILFHKIISKTFDNYTSYLCIGLYITSGYYQAFSLSLINQPLCIMLIFWNIYTFQNLKLEDNKSILLVVISSSLLLMNYIIGRYLFLIIYLYFFIIFLQALNTDQNLNFKRFKIFLLKYFNILLYIILFLTIIYPPNLITIFSLEIFDPNHMKGERVVFSEKILFEKILYNIKYFYDYFILGTLDNNNVYFLQYSVPYPIINKFLLIFFAIGFIFSIKDKKTYLFYFLLLSTLFLCLLSSNTYGTKSDEIPIYSTLGGTRLYILIPFLIFFISRGLLIAYSYLSSVFYLKDFKKNVFIIFLILIFFAGSILQKLDYKEYVKSLKFNDFSNIKNNKPIYHYHLQDIFYHIYMKKLSEEISDNLKNKKIDNKNSSNKTPYFIYVNDMNNSLKFATPPGVEPLQHKYVMPVFLSLYLNQLNDSNLYSYLVKNGDQQNIINKILRKLNQIFKKQVFKHFKPSQDQDYYINKSSYFLKNTHVLILNEKELRFVKKNYPNLLYEISLNFNFLDN